MRGSCDAGCACPGNFSSSPVFDGLLRTCVVMVLWWIRVQDRWLLSHHRAACMSVAFWRAWSVVAPPELWMRWFLPS